MRLDRLTLHRYGQFEDLELQIPAGTHEEFGRLRLTLIVGQNGTGKTTLFRFLSEILGDATDPKVAGCCVVYRIGRSRRSLGNSTELPIQVPTQVIVSTYSPADGFGLMRNTKQRLVPLKYLGWDVERMHRQSRSPSRIFFGEVVSLLLGGNEERRSQVDYLLSRIGYDSEFRVLINGEWASGLHLMRAFDDTSEVREAALRWADFVRSMSRETGTGRRIHKLLWLGREELNYYPAGLDGVAHDLKTLAQPPRGKGFLPIWGISFQRSGEWIPLDGFSSGERALFFRFLSLIREVNDDSLILIDEPEIHLHPAWVQRFIGLLVSLFRNVRAHILIASHSPLIASDVPADCILGLKKSAGRIVPYSVSDRSLGTSPSVILREVFGLPDELGDFTRHIIGRTREMIAAGKYEQALTLYDLLGDSDEKYQLFRELRALRERSQ